MMLEQREYEYKKGGYYENHRYQEFHEEDSYYKVGQGYWKRYEVRERDFREDYKTMKILSIPIWIKDVTIGIHVNKK